MIQWLGSLSLDTKLLNELGKACAGVSVFKDMPNHLNDPLLQNIYLIGNLRVKSKLSDILQVTDIIDKIFVSLIAVVSYRKALDIAEKNNLKFISIDTKDVDNRLLLLFGSLLDWKLFVIRGTQSEYNKLAVEVYNMFVAKGLRHLWNDCEITEQKGEILICQH